MRYLAFSIFLILSKLSAQVGSVYPSDYAPIIDQTYLDEEFWDFTVILAYAVKERNWSIFESLLADTISESNDGCKGCSKADFLSYIKRDLNFWDDVEASLRFGFARISGKDPFARKSKGLDDAHFFQSPSFLRELDFGCQDSLLILGENVRLRSGPGLGYDIIQTSSYGKFKCDCNVMQGAEFPRMDNMSWVRVYTPTKRTAFVALNLTSLKISRTITVSKVLGEWKITSVFRKPGC